MSAMSAAVAEAVEGQVRRLTAGLGEPERSDAVVELRAWFYAHLPEGASAGDVEGLAVEAGPVDDGVGEEGSRRGLSGRVAGIPYDFTVPSAGKVGARLWDPMDPRLLRPHLFGVGWTPNFGAVAVRLRLIEPDAEDVPFEHTTDTAFRATLAWPAAVTALAVARYADPRLPDRLARHWSWNGRPDRWATRSTAAVADLTTTAVALGLAGSAAGAASARGATRAGAAATGAALAAVVASQLVLGTRRTAQPWALPVACAALGLATGGTLWGLARSGRAAEIRSDLTDDHTRLEA